MRGSTNAQDMFIKSGTASATIPGNTGTISWEQYGRLVILNLGMIGSTSTGTYQISNVPKNTGISVVKAITTQNGLTNCGILYADANTYPAINIGQSHTPCYGTLIYTTD